MPRTTAAGVTEESHLIDAEPAKGRLGDRADGSLNKQSLLGKSMLIGGVACLFMASTMGIITFLIRDLDFDYAAFVSLLGFSGTLLCALLGQHGDFVKAKMAWKTNAAAILTVGLCNSLSTYLGNYAYETSLSFAFIQVIKCFTPVTVLIVGLVVGVEILNKRVAGAVVTISLGMIVCVDGELNAEVFGIMVVFLGGLAEAFRLLLLQGLKLPVLDGIIVMYPPTIAVLLCFFVATEYKDMIASGKHVLVLKHPWLFILATFLGVCVNTLSVLLVGHRLGCGKFVWVLMFFFLRIYTVPLSVYHAEHPCMKNMKTNNTLSVTNDLELYSSVSLTSGLTIKLLTHMRSLMLIAVGVLLFHEVLTAQEYFGYSITFVGLMWYTYERNTQQA